MQIAIELPRLTKKREIDCFDQNAKWVHLERLTTQFFGGGIVLQLETGRRFYGSLEKEQVTSHMYAEFNSLL